MANIRLCAFDAFTYRVFSLSFNVIDGVGTDESHKIFGHFLNSFINNLKKNSIPRRFHLHV